MARCTIAMVRLMTIGFWPPAAVASRPAMFQSKTSSAAASGCIPTKASSASAVAAGFAKRWDDVSIADPPPGRAGTFSEGGALGGISLLYRRGPPSLLPEISGMRGKPFPQLRFSWRRADLVPAYFRPRTEALPAQLPLDHDDRQGGRP